MAYCEDVGIHYRLPGFEKQLNWFLMYEECLKVIPEEIFLEKSKPSSFKIPFVQL